MSGHARLIVMAEKHITLSKLQDEFVDTMVTSSEASECDNETIAAEPTKSQELPKDRFKSEIKPDYHIPLVREDVDVEKDSGAEKDDKAEGIELGIDSNVPLGVCCNNCGLVYSTIVGLNWQLTVLDDIWRWICVSLLC